MNLPRRTSPRAKAVSTAAEKPAVRYRVEVLSPQAHLFAITLEIDHPAPRQRLSLPVWIPGSYLVREFSQHLQHLQATQGGEPVPLRQLDKNSWQVTAEAGQALVLRYEVYAFDASVRTAFLDSTRGFFNATSLCLRVIGQEDQAQGLELVPGQAPAGWRVATGLTASDVDGNGFGHYTAQDYDELADCPVELGTFWSGEFMACGVPHRFVVSGAGGWFDGPVSTERDLLSASVDWFLSAFGIIAPDSSQHLVKRVIGIGGDDVVCCDENGKIVVNGISLDEPYVSPDQPPSQVTFEVYVPDGSLWVMGDNRSNSEDSRYHLDLPSKGFVGEEFVVGRAFVVSWPFEHWKWLDNYSEIFEDAGDP